MSSASAVVLHPLQPLPLKDDSQPQLQRIVELEERAAAGLCSLLRQSQKGLSRTKQLVALQADRAVVRSRRCGLEAELRLLQRRARGCEESGDSSTAADVSEIAESLLTAQPQSTAVNVLGRSALPEQVAELTRLCQQQVETTLATSPAQAESCALARRREAAARSALVAAAGLGDLLLEANRDCEALLLALSEPTASPGATDWLKPLAMSACAKVGVPLPTSDSLVQQLQAENELLAKVLRQ